MVGGGNSRHHQSVALPALPCSWRYLQQNGDRIGETADWTIETGITSGCSSMQYATSAFHSRAQRGPRHASRAAHMVPVHPPSWMHRPPECPLRAVDERCQRAQVVPNNYDFTNGQLNHILAGLLAAYLLPPPPDDDLLETAVERDMRCTSASATPPARCSATWAWEDEGLRG
ncbi:unnamed protein product [Vitrella brassicaformis CCMP3155]|uniref:Uncharacterized protein n=1 Tax=Vitrella brassicaformis (strain CCMP3155) TaxID=1169540 RepID=A0A0G4EMN5_VITBC|nr:unnamed protein product [Vitrella brassicaformis CCMP3155]|eukprot:CEL98435.1 unnamed protein product [Vitrella brassicaformis CCMP3155]